MKEFFMIQVINVVVDGAYDVHVEAHILPEVYTKQEGKRCFSESINEVS